MKERVPTKVHALFLFFFKKGNHPVTFFYLFRLYIQTKFLLGKKEWRKSMSWMGSSQVMRIMLFIFLLLVGLCILVPVVALAEGKVHITVKPGLGGEYKQMGLVPITVEVSNQGEDLEGELLVELRERYRFSGTYYQPLSLARGVTKKVTLFVPGEGLTPSSEVKVISRGREVAKTRIGGRSLGQDNLVFGVLAASQETANFLATLPKSRFPMPVRVIPLEAEDIPNLSFAMHSLSALIVNNFAVEKLNEKQLSAIKEWTEQGGLLILSGGVHFGKWSGLAELAPVTVEGTGQLDSLEALVQLAGEQTPTPGLARPLSVSRATSVKGQVLASHEEIPLFVAKKLGDGHILYVAYDLAEEPLASWSGNSSLWAEVLMKVKGSSSPQPQASVLEDLWPLHSAAERIPALKLPSISLLAIIFGVYVLFIGPVLYFIFKRIGRREWLWFVVPILAFVCAVGIYLYGSLERSHQVLAHHLSYVQLGADGEGAKLRGTTAIFVPNGGEYALRLEEEGLLLPQQEGYGISSQQVETTKVLLTEDEVQVTFRDVEFWSMRKVAVEKRDLDLGEIAADLTFHEGKLVGTITNQTGLSFRDVRLYQGRHVQKIDRLLPGETAQVELAFDSGIQAGRGMYSPQLLPGGTYDHPEFMREERMLEVLNYGYYGGYQPAKHGNLVTFIGWTEESLYELDVVGKGQKDYHLALVKAELDVQPAADGYVFYPAGTFEPRLILKSGEVQYLWDGYTVSGEELVFEFQLQPTFDEPNRKLEIEKIQLYTWSDDGTPFQKQVYNWQTESFDAYEQVFEQNKLTREKIDTYVSSDGILRLKMWHEQEGHRHLGQPVVSVEGRVQSQ